MQAKGRRRRLTRLRDSARRPKTRDRWRSASTSGPAAETRRSWRTTSASRWKTGCCWKTSPPLSGGETLPDSWDRTVQGRAHCFATLLGQRPPARGSARIGDSVQVAFYRQDLAQVPHDKTLFDIINDMRPHGLGDRFRATSVASISRETKFCAEQEVSQGESGLGWPWR